MVSAGCGRRCVPRDSSCAAAVDGTRKNPFRPPARRKTARYDTYTGLRTDWKEGKNCNRIDSSGKWLFFSLFFATGSFGSTNIEKKKRWRNINKFTLARHCPCYVCTPIIFCIKCQFLNGFTKTNYRHQAPIMICV